MAWLTRQLRAHGDTVAFVLVVLALGYALNAIQQSNIDHLTTAQIESCERGNVLRAVVYENTRAAAQSNQGTPAGQSFNHQLVMLRSTPYFLPDGTVDCRAAIDQGATDK